MVENYTERGRGAAEESWQAASKLSEDQVKQE